MKTIGLRILILILLLATASRVQIARSADWPQYGGIQRDRISPETGLLRVWPPAGPKIIWRIPVGEAYSGISVSEGRLYTMTSLGPGEFVLCLEEATGKELWRYRTDSIYKSGDGNGPRSTPVINAGMVFAVGAQGALVAINAKNGNRVWQYNIVKDFGGKMPGWGFCNSPMIEDDALIVPVGGSRGNAVMAFNKKSGAFLWKSHSDDPGYSSPIAVTIGGVRQIVVFSGTQVFAVSPTDGKLFWSYPWKTGGQVNAAVPLLVPPDKIFISSSYDQGAALLKVNVIKGKPAVEQVWKSKVMMNHFNSSVFKDGYLYGFDNSFLKCVEAVTGKEKWVKSGLGKGSLLLADGRLIILSEQGLLVLADASPVKFQQTASAQILQGRCLTEPALCGGKLFLRNQKEMVSVSLK